MGKTTDRSLEVTYAGIRFSTPFLPASGTFGYGFEPANFRALGCFGGLVTKGISFKPRHGNNPPRVRETPCGMINSVGLENPGLDVFISRILPEMRNSGKPIIVNLAGHNVEEFAMMTERLNEYDEIKAYEINISCPNVEEGGLEFFKDVKILKNLLGTIKRYSTKVNVIKIPPDIFNYNALMDILLQDGFTRITVANTYPATFVDVEEMQFYFERKNGGLSGSAIYPITLRLVYELKKDYHEVEIIGSGGVYSAEVAIQYFLAGASLVEIGSVNFVDPNIVCKIKSGVEQYLLQKGFNSISQIVGMLLPK